MNGVQVLPAATFTLVVSDGSRSAVPVNRPPTYTFPAASRATPPVSIVPVEWNALAQAYPPVESSRQANPDPPAWAATRLLVTPAAGLKSATPLNWPVTTIRPAGSTARAVAELVPPTV